MPAGEVFPAQGRLWRDNGDGTFTDVGPATIGAPKQPDQTIPYQGPQAATNLQNTQVTAQVNAATAGSQIARAGAEATTAQRGAMTAGLPEGFMWSQDGQQAIPIPGYTRQGLSPEVRSQAVTGYTDADALDKIADELQGQFTKSFDNRGLRSINEYSWGGLNPRAENQLFNSTADRARGFVKRGLGFTGGEGNTIGEINLNYGPYLPQAGDKDATIEAKIQALRDLAQQSRERSVALLGGIPDANGNVTPLPQGVTLENALTMNRVMGGSQNMPAAGFGATTGAQQIPPEMQAEHQAWLGQNIGNFSPKAYADFRAALDTKYGLGVNYDAYLNFGNDLAEKLKQGGVTVGDIPAADRELSQTEQFRNNLAVSPLGAGAINYADAVGLGGVQALAPGQMDALAEENPWSSLAGQIGGGVTGTNIIGKLGREAALRAAPRLLAGDGAEQFGRNLATDVTYGAGYGGVSEGDPLSGAMWAGVGSAGGQALAKGAGALVGGVKQLPEAMRLADRGVDMTVGQRMGGLGGRILGDVEEKATSVPLLGDVIDARYREGFGSLNRAAFDEAGAPIGATTQGTGQAGLLDMRNQIGQAYDNATAGMQIPLDDEFAQGLLNTRNMAREGLPRSGARTVDTILSDRVKPLVDNGTMTGDDYQRLMRVAKGTKNKVPAGMEPFEDRWRDVFNGLDDAARQQVERAGGSKVTSALKNADEAYRNYSTLNDAVGRARNGTRTGEVQTFAPSQLNDAAYATQKKFPGPRPFAQLADDAQTVLPSKTPDSGTVGRALVGGGLLGLGAAGGAASNQDNMLEGGTEGLGTSAGVIAALAAGGSRPAQRLLQEALFERPDILRRLSEQRIRRSAPQLGHIGTAAYLQD